MKKSKVTEYMTEYLRQNEIAVEDVAEQTGINPDKLKRDYKEPLDAVDFLTLCSFLKIKPEQVAQAIKKDE